MRWNVHLVMKRAMKCTTPDCEKMSVLCAEYKRKSRETKGIKDRDYGASMKRAVVVVAGSVVTG